MSNWAGFPIWVSVPRPLDSPSAKAAYGLEEDQNGVLVIKVFEDSPADGVLQENDVILAVDDQDIADDGTIRITDDVLTDYKHAIDLHHIGEAISIRYSRNGRTQTVDLLAEPALPSYSLVASEQFDRVPEYYTYGGISIRAAEHGTLSSAGEMTGAAPPRSVCWQARNEWSSSDRRAAGCRPAGTGR